jgi:hypothetical protein
MLASLGKIVKGMRVDKGAIELILKKLLKLLCLLPSKNCPDHVVLSRGV